MSTHPASTGPRDDLPGVERLLALSDGVVAIAITLLVLELNASLPAGARRPHLGLRARHSARQGRVTS